MEIRSQQTRSIVLELLKSFMAVHGLVDARTTVFAIETAAAQTVEMAVAAEMQKSRGLKEFAVVNQRRVSCVHMRPENGKTVKRFEKTS
jgi:hypothetical protein